MSINQLQVDIGEFVINNREEILQYLNEECDHLKYAERLFESCPDLYDEMVDNFKLGKLRSYISNYFKDPIDNIYLIVDHDFVKLTLQY